MCYIDGQKNKYSVLNECSRMLKYNILQYYDGFRGMNWIFQAEDGDQWWAFVNTVVNIRGA
jgi:L-rhamnose mutarotase